MFQKQQKRKKEKLRERKKETERERKQKSNHTQDYNQEKNTGKEKRRLFLNPSLRAIS